MAKTDKVLSQRFECVEDGHSKFWAFREVGPGKFEASWGKIGKEPQGTKLYTQDEITALIPAKRKKGYVLV
jgi:predicted DNA-binding WGR domain protein